MLTKNDLNQIRKVVKEEIEIEVTPLSKKIDVLDKKLSSKIDTVDKKLDKVQEDVGEYLNRLEPRVTIVEERVGEIEESLNFSKPQ